MTDTDELAVTDAEGEDLPDEALAELAAIEDEGTEAETADQASDELGRLRADLDAEREARRAAVARYREAVLAAEPALPPDLVAGDSLAEVDTSVEAARRAVAQIRERLAAEADEDATRGFPVGAPGRLEPSVEGMSSAEKIALGLERRAGS
ncbi:MAG: hypothetical protein OXH97_02945 [Chloroflexota bacterium]|nr:hypothetical protein [Chloroflexota bacterium]